MSYTIGIDFGTESGRVFLVNTKNGKIIEKFIRNYTHGTFNKLNGKKFPENYALQNSNDYLEVLLEGIPSVIKKAGIKSEQIKGIGIDFTSSTVIFVNKNMDPIHTLPGFENNPHAYVKLWKHHGAEEEANQLLKVAIQQKQKWFGNYGYNVSSEWMIPKIMEVMKKSPEVIEETYAIMEAGDWIVNILTGKNIRSNCGLGFKSFWEENKGFHYELFDVINPDLSNIVKEKLDAPVINIGEKAGSITKSMANMLGLCDSVTVSPFIIDAHSSLLGIGADKQNQMTIVMGTSTCHLMLNESQQKIPGISGSVKGAIIPNLYAYEAGQSAVGDLFEYAVKQTPYSYVIKANEQKMSVYEYLENLASNYEPGETGLIALDWHNGNRSILSDSSLKGMLFGLTLNTKHEDIYRAYMEATAFGTKMIVNQYESWGMYINSIFACGGIPKKSRLLMRIYTDVLNKPITVIDSEYSPAIGAAILGAVSANIYPTIEEAVKHMKEPSLYTIQPDNNNVKKYKKLFSIYKKIHDIHGYKNKR